MEGFTADFWQFSSTAAIIYFQGGGGVGRLAAHSSFISSILQLFYNWLILQNRKATPILNLW